MRLTPVVLPLILLQLALLPACGVRKLVMRKAVGDLYEYLDSPASRYGAVFEKVSPHAYTFRWSHYRNLAVDTNDGWVVFDPLNPEAAKELKAELEKVAPGKKIHTVVYSHYHLDHASGGAVFAPAEVIAHPSDAVFWKDLDAKDILAPTRLVDSDQTLSIGGIEIQMLFLGKSHTNALFAFLLPGERLLYTVDLGQVRALSPIGGPDTYVPGMMKAFDRLAALDFDIFVPGHFAYGKKADFTEYVAYMKESTRLCHESFEMYGPQPRAKEEVAEGWEHFFEPMEEKYSSWHGFDQMILFQYARCFTGETLGY